MRIFIALLALVSLISTTPGRTEAALPGGPQFVSWAASQGVKLGSLDWPDLDPAALRILDAMVAGKRIVYLGETSHFVRQKYDFRKLMLSYLFHHGFHLVGLEMGRSDGKRVDRYLQSGDPRQLERVAVEGYRGDRNQELESKATGYLKWKNPEAVRAAVSADRGTLNWLESVNHSGMVPVVRKFFGFDVDTIPGGGFVDVRMELAAYCKYAPVAGLSHLLDVRTTDPLAEVLGRLDSARKYLKAQQAPLEKALGARLFTEVSGDLQCISDGFQFAQGIYPLSGTDPRVVELMTIREHTMFRQMEELLSSLGPDEKIVLMGQGMHLSKDSETAGFGPAGQSFPMWPSIGSYLSSRLPGQVASIWMIQNQGSQTDPGCETLTCPLPKSDPTYLSYYLHQLGSPALLLPTAGAAFLDQRLNFIGNSSPIYNANFSRNADLIFYVDQVTGF